MSEPNENTTKFRNEENSNSYEKTVYLDLSILDLSKTVTYAFWFDYVKPKYDEKAKP